MIAALAAGRVAAADYASITTLHLGGRAPLALLLRRVPVLPLPRPAAAQLVAAQDVADLVGRAVLARAAGTFNVAGEPVLTPAVLARLLGGRHLPASREALKRLPP
ncbi:hypothetical protein [Actinoplanes sp. NPDC026623]|uniref:hypothetical protein n=1 Tax=Actinoplanes sp. NPDC026623 TaxID=3155610 RepID=UPI0033E0B343